MIENDYIRKGGGRNEATIVHTLEEKCAILGVPIVKQRTQKLRHLMSRLFDL